VWNERVAWQYRDRSNYQLIVREYSLYDFEDEIPEYLEDTSPTLEIVYQGVNIWGNTYQTTFATFGGMPLRTQIVESTIKTVSEYLEQPNICLGCLGRMDWISGWGDYSCRCSR
jgi:hypothetical protein